MDRDCVTMMAPASHNGFPFPIREASAIWDGTDYTADQTTVCGPGTRYPLGMTIQQMAQLYWRAKAYKLTASFASSTYGVATYSASFDDTAWPDLDTPDDTLEYYQARYPGLDEVQTYPNSQPDNDIPWMIVVPVYQVFNGVAPASMTSPPSGYFYTPSGGSEGNLNQQSPAWMLRLFEYGALRIDSTYYPSIELTLTSSGSGSCGCVTLVSTEEALP
jgi:hypothetical protein